MFSMPLTRRCVTIDLPRDTVRTWSRACPLSTRPMKPRILVIDDESAIRDSLKMILEYEDYDFFGAASGPDGVASVKRDAPDLVLLDIKMPGTNGLETLAEIRRSR